MTEHTENIELEKQIDKAVYCTRKCDIAGLHHIFKRKLVDVNARAPDGYTLLYVACTRKAYDMIEYLVSQGADIHARIEDDMLTPIIFARKKRDMAMVRILLTPPTKIFTDVDIEKPQEGDDDIKEIVNFPQVTDGLCTICFDKIEEGDFYKIDGCGHNAFCKECVGGWFSAKLREAQLPKCPYRGCGVHASAEDIIACVNESFLIERYDQIVLGRALIFMRDFRWCQACPDGGFVSADCRSAACLGCDAAFCAECLLPTHENVTCEAAFFNFIQNDRSYHETESMRYVKKYSRPCPECKSPIERNGGCSHITCKVCTYQFCWLCLGPYKGRHTFSNVCPCNK